jgi:hypothetical protein
MSFELRNSNEALGKFLGSTSFLVASESKET